MNGMVADEGSDFFPLADDDAPPQFDVVMRGYERRQVDAWMERLQAEVAELTDARDDALAVAHDRANLIAELEDEIDALRYKAASVEHIDSGNISERIHDMLKLARDEAAQVRRSAEEEAERTLAAARAEAERLREDAHAEQQRLTSAAAQRAKEADDKLVKARTTANGEIESARSKAKLILSEAKAERDRLDAEAKASRDALIAEADAERQAKDRLADQRRATANDDFEITLRERRKAAEAAVAAVHAERDQARQTLKELQARISEALREL